MRYIQINPRSLSTKVVGFKVGRAIYIPVRVRRHGSAMRDMLHYTAYFDVLYRVAGPSDQKDRARSSASLQEPDPWFVALVALMWQGLVEGLTWDVIKVSCLLALDKLRRQRLAPPASAMVATRRKLKDRDTILVHKIQWWSSFVQTIPRCKTCLQQSNRERAARDSDC